MATMNISLPDAMKAFVESEVATGRYANASDYVRNAIRRDQQRRDELVALLAASEKEGGEHDFDAIIAEAKAAFRSRAD